MQVEHLGGGEAVRLAESASRSRIARGTRRAARRRRPSSSTRTDSRGLERRRACASDRSSTTSSTWFGSSASHSSSASADGGRGRARGRSAGRVPRRPRRRRAGRRGDDRDAGGSASTGRGRARRRDGVRGSRGRRSPRVARSLSSSPSTQPRNRTSPATAPASRRAASRCSSWRRAASAAVSAAASHVPFDPSVHTRWWTMHPAAAHFASVPPQPNSTSSGWAPIASAEAGGVEVERPPPRVGEAGGCPGSFAAMSAVPRGWMGGPGRPACRRRATGRDRRAPRRRSRWRPLAIACARWRRNDPRAVGRRDRRTCRERHHVGAVAAPIGDEGDTARRGRPRRGCAAAAGRRA